jgi:hypothetical protein
MEQKVGRNDPCPCGSGKKYKNCCIGKPIRKPLPFKAKLLTQPKTVDLMARTFGDQIAEAEKLTDLISPTEEETPTAESS